MCTAEVEAARPIWYRASQSHAGNSGEKGTAMHHEGKSLNVFLRDGVEMAEIGCFGDTYVYRRNLSQFEPLWSASNTAYSASPNQFQRHGYISSIVYAITSL